MNDHVYFNDQKEKWSFWDEAGLDSYQYYDTREEAEEGLKQYAKWLEGTFNQ